MPSRLVSNLQSLERQVVDAARQDGEMAGGQDRNVAHDHVAAAFESDRLVGDAGRIGPRQARFERFASTQAPAADETRFATSWMSSPQIKLLCRWLWPKSW